MGPKDGSLDTIEQEREIGGGGTGVSPYRSCLPSQPIENRGLIHRLDESLWW